MYKSTSSKIYHHVCLQGKGMMDTYWLEGIRESLGGQPTDEKKTLSEYVNPERRESQESNTPQM